MINPPSPPKGGLRKEKDPNAWVWGVETKGKTKYNGNKITTITI